MLGTYPKILFTGTQAEYNALADASKLETTKLYWTSDTNKIYKGAVDFSEYITVVNALPSTVATRAIGKLYLNTTDGKVSFYDGSAWHTVSLPAATTMLGSSGGQTIEVVDQDHVPTTQAVSEFVHEVIGGSSTVVKQIAAGTTAGVFTYTTADDIDHDVTVPGVYVGIDDKEVSSEAVAATFVLKDSDGVDTEYVVPKVMTGISASSSVDGQIDVTLSSGSHASVTVPGVFKSVSWNSTTRKLTFTDTDGVSTGEDHEVDLGKDIFIDKDAPNRYENGNIYLYLNDGTTSGSTTTDTEIVIPVTGLIVDYVGGDTNSVTLTVDNTTHEVTADAVLRADVAGEHGFTNALKLSSNTAATGGVGLYVDNSEIEANIDALGVAITWGAFTDEA